MAAAMTAMTANRRSGSSAALMPPARQRDATSASAMSAIANAL